LAKYNDKRGAIMDFVYNLGVGRLQASTLRRKINVQDWRGAAKELRKWVYGGGRKLPGLVLRREAESIFFLTEEE
jgi:lysozyme